MHPAFEGLKERKLVQWALAYLAGAWLVLQVVDLLADTYGWSPVLRRSLPLLLAVGLLFALVLAWYHGEKGVQRVTGPEFLLLTLLVVTAAGGMAWMGRRTPEATDPARTSVPATENSIAVLPFANLSPDPEQDYFSDGLTEELLIALAHMPGLKVAARTSSFAFEGTKVPVTEIGQALGVAYVLEGSVRKAGDRVRISMKLVSTADGYEVWSQSYDRKLRDLLLVQEEISRAVVDALPLELPRSPLPPLVRGSTESIEAHELYLHGRHAWNRRTAAELHRAIDYFEQAVRIDPTYARAYAALAEAYVVLPGYARVDHETVTARAEAAALQALKLDPGLAEAYNALGIVYEYYRWEWDAAETAFRRALQINPNYANAYQWYGEFLTIMGRGAEGEAALRRALELDPLSPIIRSDFGQVLYHGRAYDRAIAHLETLVREHPDLHIAHLWLMLSYIGTQRYPEAATVAGPAALLLGMEPAVVRGVVGALTDPARRPETLRALDEHRRGGSALAQVVLPAFYALLGADEQALELLEEAYRTRSAFLPYLHVTPAMDSIRAHPRYRRLLQQLRFESPEG